MVIEGGYRVLLSNTNIKVFESLLHLGGTRVKALGSYRLTGSRKAASRSVPQTYTFDGEISYGHNYVYRVLATWDGYANDVPETSNVAMCVFPHTQLLDSPGPRVLTHCTGLLLMSRRWVSVLATTYYFSSEFTPCTKQYQHCIVGRRGLLVGFLLDLVQRPESSGEGGRYTEQPPTRRLL